ncbi:MULTISPECIES: DUF2953 domain-containing protein [Clostridium]|uniref:DUF2953 domain-containing protein n=1 Tax=Clostridium TaxID=1485 RepID=UPI001FA7BC39|nr:DUF2953 domain-containing protein [Clostridium pasteurianum]
MVKIYNIILIGRHIMYLIIILIILILIPFPVKVSFLYFEGKYSIFVYKKKLKFRVSRTERKVAYYFDTLTYINKNKNKFLKYSSKFKFSLGFGIADDAACTAIIFGFMNCLNSFFYNLFSTFFKIKNFNYKVLPYFQKDIFKIEFESIIWVSIAKTIYNLIILFYLKFKLHIKLKNKGSVHNG